ncbi:MAG TPA: VWA domain-containing protein [Pyrinomonadaceae bacterium]|nr:VWA domain-containing protein [Pyrinomonadaceae bacterium]
MKLSVARALRVSQVTRVCVLLLTTAALFVTLVPAQTSKRGTTKRSANKTSSPTKTDMLTICQGVPVPSGYVIVAYITTSACPHGAYVIRKQDSYSESVANTYSKRKGTASAPATASRQPPRDSGDSRDSDTPFVDDPFAPAPQVTTNNNRTVTSTPQTTTVDPVSTSALASNGTGAGSRPRRVANAQPNVDTVAVVDDEPERPARPPQWAGTAPSRTPVATSDAVVDPGPEEVSEGDVIRVDTSFVSVPVSVVDRQGRFIPNLKREDFTIFENGVQQQVAHFEPADKPFTVALLLDTSPSTQFHLWQIKEAAVAFAKQLRPQDRVLVVSFNDQVLLLTEVTNDMNVISAVIEEHANMGTATRVYDAVHLVIKERLNKIKGRKAIVLFSDGVDTASYQATYESTMRGVEELDALIYPIQYDTTDYLRAMQGIANGGPTTVVTTNSGPFGTTTSRVTYNTPTVTGPNGGPLPGATQADYDRANQYLNELADKTAGRLYKANDPAQLAHAFSQIAEELRRQYSLGYYPQGADGSAASAAAADRRQIKVRVNRPNVAVKARDSYVRGGSQ